ncbi:hypothetical protein GUJ93_ZPchr0007g5257 [Zizania palustris]|uniref:Uncharacterized protein n=1 Tax=Zizania palustris TaxID=103762 RepID=A0A8J5W024_ZIZPA|nr:hypothetical protein GUJ93_ZPchr0007g5257 [Zizania palustris]
MLHGPAGTSVNVDGIANRSRHIFRRSIEKKSPLNIQNVKYLLLNTGSNNRGGRTLNNDGSDSIAVQLVDEAHRNDLVITIAVEASNEGSSSFGGS